QGLAGRVVGEQAKVVFCTHKGIAVGEQVDFVEGQIYDEYSGSADEDAQDDDSREQEQIALPAFLQLAVAGTFIKLDRSSAGRLHFGCFWHTRFLHSLLASTFCLGDQPALAISWLAWSCAACRNSAAVISPLTARGK